MAAKRTRRSAAAWSNLSASQQARYIGAARTGSLTGTPITGTSKQVAAAARRYYLSGGGLQRARGHAKPAPKTRAPKDVLDKLAPPKKKGQRPTYKPLTAKDQADLRKWQQSSSPQWIRTAGAIFSEDTAAILSKLDLQPQNWKSVTVFQQPDGTYKVYFESRKGGKTRVITLLDRAMVDELEDYVALKNGVPGQVGAGQEIPLNRRGTDVTAVRSTTPPPTAKVGKALPKRKR